MIINREDKEIKNLIRQPASPKLQRGEWADSPKRRDVKILSFGLDNNNDLIGDNIQLNGSNVRFKVEYLKTQLGLPRETPQGGNPESLGVISPGEFSLNIPGQFSVYNALAAVALGLSEGIEP